MNEFVKKLDEEMKITGDAVASFPWEDPKAYGMWLAQTHNMVLYSTRIVALAGARASIKRESLHERFVDHAREERGHPKMCIKDLENLGLNVEEFPITYQSSVLYQIQYYWIEHINPASFFGYALSLEAIASKFGGEIYRRVSEAHGPKASTFLKLHTVSDVDHVEKGIEEVYELDNEELKVATENLVVCCELYRDMLRSIESATCELGDSREAS